MIYRRKLASNKFITFSPRYIIENIGFIFIAILAYKFSNDNSATQNGLPVLGTFAVAAQKLLPSMQQCYNSIGTIRSNKSSVFKVLEILNQKNYIIDSKEIKPLNFKDSISLSNIAFKYPYSKNFILRDVSLLIKKGERIGVIGKQGVEKRLITDILMGLLKPTKGSIKIDGVNLYKKNIPEILFQWRLAIAHVPQNIYLSDKTIAENIAFGIPIDKIDFSKLEKVSKKAQIFDFIKSSKNKFLTKVGENGLKLSGGQRQRIGIARALYNDAQIIFFDEATSALDNITEKALINSLNLLDSNLTIIIVAHRLSTIKNCDRVIKVEDLKLEEI